MVDVVINPSVSLAGTYSIRLPSENSENNFTLRISDETFSLSGGCNIHSWTYNALKSPRTITFGLVRSTRRACVKDNDSLYLASFLSGTNYVRDSADGFVLLDNEGNSVIRMINRNPPIFIPPTPTPTPVEPESLAGKYLLSFPGKHVAAQYELEADDHRFSLQGGCNIHSFDYTANGVDNSIIFGSIASTRRFCLHDEDYIALQAFTGSNAYIRRMNGFYLNDGYEVTVEATVPPIVVGPLPADPPVSDPLVSDPTPPTDV